MTTLRGMRSMAALFTVSVLLVAWTAQAQPDYAKVLVGKWEGDVREPRSRTPPDRTLVIRSIGKSDGPLPVKAQYGVTGGKLNRLEGTLDTSGARPVLRLTTSGGSTIVLRLHDEKSLIGTIDYPGTGQQLQEHPLRLKKVE